MTTTKEEQTRADFEKRILDITPSMDLSRNTAGEYNDMWLDVMWEDHKACAESYEKKLAEKDENRRFIDCEYFNMQKQLSEANARNAWLVEAGNKALEDWEAQSTYTPDGILKLDQAITANSEAVAAWEARDKLKAELALTKQKLTTALIENECLSAFCKSVGEDLEATETIARKASFDLISVKKDLFQAEQDIRESQEQEPFCYMLSSPKQEQYHGQVAVQKTYDSYWNFDIPLYTKPVVIPQLAEQLHIKELREALVDCERHAKSMAVWGGTSWKYHPPQAGKIASSAANALAKQPDTRALDKALLEAELRGLNRNEERKETRCKLRRQF